MKRTRRSGGSVVRSILLFSLLAALCIGGAELAVCRYEDPLLFEEWTEPFTDAVRMAGDRVQDAGNYLRYRMEEAERAREEARARAAAEAQARAEAEALALSEARVIQEAETLNGMHLKALSGSAQIAGLPAIHTDFVPVDPNITELVALNGSEYLLGGNVLLTYFNQADEEWLTKPFGIDPIGSHGCGPTALAMAVTSLTGQTVDPAEMAAWAASEGYAAPHSGAYLTVVQGAAAHFGLECTTVETLDADTLCRALSGGGVMVALMGPGHFTSAGHFILLHGLTLSGEVLVADPYSREKSLMVWDPQLIVDELSTTRYGGSPLWLLSVSNSL